MNKYRYSINIDWSGKGLNPKRLGEKMLETVDALSSIDAVLNSWWFIDMENRAYVPVDEIRSKMTQLIEQGVVMDDFDEPEPESGYTMRIENEKRKTAKTLVLEMNGGGSDTDSLSEGIVLSPAIGIDPDPAITRYAFVKAMTMALVSVWRPACGSVFMTEQDMESWRDADRLFEPQWMTYLSAEMAAEVVPPADIICERTADGGLLLVATEETYDYENPDHAAAALAISDALAGFSFSEAM